MFRISALPKVRFQHLFDMSDEELKAHGALRRTATEKPGFPCRISLQDAEPGEEVILVHFEHHSADSPFRSSHALYVRPTASEAKLQAGEVPRLLRSRTLSLRAYDENGMMIDARLAEGRVVENEIERQLAQSATRYIHLHSALPGCYLARVDRLA